MLGAAVPSVNDVELAATVFTMPNPEVALVDRQTSKPVSIVLVSAQVSPTWLKASALADRLVGATGIAPTTALSPQALPGIVTKLVPDDGVCHDTVKDARPFEAVP